jgi:hypothetical protein
MINRVFSRALFEGEPKPFRKKDFEISHLKLACLKRNLEFIKFFEAVAADPHKAFRELRISNETDDKFKTRIGVMAAEGGPYFGGRAEEFGVYPEFIVTVQEYMGVQTDEILDLLHPRKDMEDISPVLKQWLPLLFYAPGIEEIPLTEKSELVRDLVLHSRNKNEVTFPGVPIEPWEKTIKIDLRRPRSQLIHEITALIDLEREVLRAGKKYLPAMIEAGYGTSGLFDWDVDNSRLREEAWGCLDVWDMRRDVGSRRRRLFSEIARTTGLNEDQARQRYYRAYELTQGEKYNLEVVANEVRKINKIELARTCDNCEERSTCQNPCPDILAFIEQDHVK